MALILPWHPWGAPPGGQRGSRQKRRTRPSRPRPSAAPRRRASWLFVHAIPGLQASQDPVAQCGGNPRWALAQYLYRDGV